MQTKFALAWNRSVIKNGAKWSLHPPTKKELYPNMGISGKYYSTKKKMAEESGELTMLWQCNVNNRNIALENGISSWKDPNCNSEKLGIGGVRGRVIDKIIMRMMDILMALPSILLAIVVVSILGPGLNNAIIAVAIVSTPESSRSRTVTSSGGGGGGP